jgi:hypothetical protein
MAYGRVRLAWGWGWGLAIIRDSKL